MNDKTDDNDTFIPRGGGDVSGKSLTTPEAKGGGDVSGKAIEPKEEDEKPKETERSREMTAKQ